MRPTPPEPQEGTLITAEHIHLAAQRMDAQRELGVAWLRWRLCPRTDIRERLAARREFQAVARRTLRLYR